MQGKLAIWASEDGERRFDRLLRLIANGSWLQEAARITLSSKGASTPGIDGMDKQAMVDSLQDQLENIRSELLAGSYQPQPARRVYIPKAGGKQRPLGIPTLRDRIVQRAMLMVMEPIWESDFHRLSYGFRPERSVHHAIRTVKFQLQDGSYTAGRWVIEGDLASYFDTVHHKLLTSLISGWKGNTLATRLAKIAGHGTLASPKGVPLPSGKTGSGNQQWRIADMPMTS